MKVGARLYAQLEDKVLDIVAPSVEPVVGFGRRYLHKWVLNYLLDNHFDKPIKTLFVDVGACVGSWGIVMADNYPDSKVLCIEPYKDNYECLRYNSRNHKNIYTLNAAADKDNGIIRLSLPDINDVIGNSPIELWNNYGLITAYGLPDKCIFDARAVKLDSILNNVGVLKIDVEGMEMRVLKGADRILREDHPLLQVEAIERNQRRAGHSIQELHDYIMTFGYKFIGDYEGDNLYVFEGRRNR